MTRLIRLSTNTATQAEAFEQWRADARMLHGVTEEWEPSADGAFRGEAEISISGPFRRLQVRSATRVSRRGGHEISDRPHGAYVICREMGDGSFVDAERQSFALPRGDLIVLDFDRPCLLQAPRGFTIDMIALPRTLIDPHLPGRRSAHCLRISGRQGVEALASDLFRSIVRAWDAIGADQMATIADSLGRLIGVASGAAAQENREAVADGRLAAAESYIVARLADPRLSAAGAAAALKISERALHAAFESRGATFGARVRRRRIEECRAALLAQPSRAITDIALAWGFGSVPSFYRAFQAAYGVAPGELREIARDEAQPAKAMESDSR